MFFFMASLWANIQLSMGAVHATVGNRTHVCLKPGKLRYTTLSTHMSWVSCEQNVRIFYNITKLVILMSILNIKIYWLT